MQYLVLGNDRGLDQVKSAQERKADRLSANDCRHHREALVFHMAVERGEVFDLLPRTNPIGSNQQQERLGFRDFLGEFGQPKPRAQRNRGEEDLCRRVNPAQADAHSLGEGCVPGIEREEYPHVLISLDLTHCPKRSLSPIDPYAVNSCASNGYRCGTLGWLSTGMTNADETWLNAIRLICRICSVLLSRSPRYSSEIIDPKMECAPGAGQDHAAVLTLCRAW